MRKFLLFFLVSFFIIFGNSVSAYIIEENESVTDVFIPPANVTEHNFSIKPDLSPKKYVKSYVVGGSTAIQICEVGGLTCEHAYNGGEEYIKNEIVAVTPPTCTENGSMTIKCNYYEVSFRCNNTVTIELLKTDHTITEHIVDKKCENCGEIHSKDKLIDNQSDLSNHFYSCKFSGCEEKISEVHDFKQDEKIKKWKCSVCGYEDSRHKALDKWSGDGIEHYKRCAVDGCNEKFEVGAHSGGNHDNDGICLECSNKYQTHNIDTSNFTPVDMGHLYGCSYNGCEAKILEDHQKDTIPLWNSESHWYGCRNEQCGIRIDETPHSDGGNGDGVCLDCKRKYDGELETFKIKNIEDEFYNFEKVNDNVKLEIEYSPSNLAADFIFESSDNSVATVTQDGVITAVSKGITVISVSWKEEKISITVYVEIDEFEIEADDKELIEDYNTQIRVITENITGKISWSVSPNRLAAIDKDGVLYAYPCKLEEDTEEVTVYAVLENGVPATTKVIIKHDLKEEYDFDDNNHWKECQNDVCMINDPGKHYHEEPHTSDDGCTKCDWKPESSGGSDSPGGNDNPPGGSDSPGGNDNPPGGSDSPGGNDNPPGGSDSPGGNDNPPGGSDSTPGGSGGPGEEEDPNEGEGSISSPIWYHDEHGHWQIIGGHKTEPQEHIWSNGECQICHRKEKYEVNEEECNHPQCVYWYLGSSVHKVICQICGKEWEEPCDGESCHCKKDGVKDPETDLFIPTKVFYIEETDNPLCIYSIIKGQEPPEDEYFFQVKAVNPPKYSWEMRDNMGVTLYGKGNCSSNNTESTATTDGTIMFWYDKSRNAFCAKLNPSNREKLYEEIKIRITLTDGVREDSQEIKLIKKGPPRSYCQVLFESDRISLEDNKLKLFVRTRYNDFEDYKVHEFRKNTDEENNEFPIYTVKDGSVKIESQDTSVLQLIGEPDIIEVTDDKYYNGYIVEIPIRPIKEGKVKVSADLTTEYSYRKHKSVENERSYLDVINVVKFKDAAQAGVPGDSSTTPPASEPGEGSDSGLGKAILAAVSALALLLIVFVGSKVLGHR